MQTPQTWLDHQVEEEELTGDLIFNFDFLEGVFPDTVMQGIVTTVEGRSREGGWKADGRPRLLPPSYMLPSPSNGDGSVSSGRK